MYRQGLGDCFLLTFDVDGTQKHMLVDCGSLGNKATSLETGALTAAIRDATGGHLDVLVVTHEHKDHVSGFANATLENLPARRVWLAWTEDPSDALARDLARVREDLGQALVAAAGVLRGRGAGARGRDIALRIDGLLDWYGQTPSLGFAKTINALMEEVRARGNVRYLRPGELLEGDAALPGFRVYVLGPPRDEAALKRTGEHHSGELYGVAASLRAALAFRASSQTLNTLMQGEDRERDLIEQQMPFDPRFRLERRGAAVSALPAGSYFEPRSAWRRIDDDWLDVLPDLALQLDAATNNTSLVLAIERIADGKVLLLPGDAQEGSWLSWHDLSWRVREGDRDAQVITTGDLLSRTVFYKVGHHASHNATARGKGLELMRSRELVAFIPVDREIALARNPKGSWKMPARTLYRRLLERCDGRVARSDLGWAADSKSVGKRSVEKEFDDMASRREWSDWGRSQAEAEAAGRVRVQTDAIDFLLE